MLSGINEATPDVPAEAVPEAPDVASMSEPQIG